MFTNLDIYYNEMKLGIQELVSIKLQIKELQKEEKVNYEEIKKIKHYALEKGTHLILMQQMFLQELCQIIDKQEKI